MVDALASGASVPRDVEVQVLSRVPKYRANHFLISSIFFADLNRNSGRGVRPACGRSQGDFPMRAVIAIVKSRGRGT